MDIKKTQIDAIKTIAGVIINDLQDREGLYIIDQSLNARVLFYYKPDILFVSDSFPLNITNNFIDLKDAKMIADICDHISHTFEGTDYLTNSRLVKDIDKFIEQYMIDSLIICVDRPTMEILEILSLEYYNELFLINLSGMYRLIDIDGSVFKYDITSLLDNFDDNNGYTIFNKLLCAVYSNDSRIFPVKNRVFNNLEKFTRQDIQIDDNDLSPVFLLSNIASNAIISYERIINGTEKFFSYDTLYGIISSILDMDKSSDSLIEDIQDIIRDNYYYDTASDLIN